VIVRPELLRFLPRRGHKMCYGLLRSFLPEQQDAQIELRLVQPRLEFENRPVTRDGFCVAPQQTQRQRQVKLGGVVLCVRLNRFGEIRDRFLVTLCLQCPQPFGGGIGSLRHQNGDEGEHPHTLPV